MSTVFAQHPGKCIQASVSAIRQVIDDGTDMYGVEVELSTLSILQMEVKFLHPLCILLQTKM